MAFPDPLRHGCRFRTFRFHTTSGRVAPAASPAGNSFLRYPLEDALLRVDAARLANVGLWRTTVFCPEGVRSDRQIGITISVAVIALDFRLQPIQKGDGRVSRALVDRAVACGIAARQRCVHIIVAADIERGPVVHIVRICEVTRIDVLTIAEDRFLAARQRPQNAIDISIDDMEALAARNVIVVFRLRDDMGFAVSTLDRDRHCDRLNPFGMGERGGIGLLRIRVCFRADPPWNLRERQQVAEVRRIYVRSCGEGVARRRR